MKMKTLKDIEFVDCMYIPSDVGVREILQQTAKKWIEKLEKKSCDHGNHDYCIHCEESCKDCIDDEGNEVIADWIKKFFNLEKEID